LNRQKERFVSELGGEQSPEDAFAAVVAVVVVVVAAVQELILRGLVRTTAEEDADQVLAGWAAWLLLLIETFFDLLDTFISYMEGTKNNHALTSHTNFRSIRLWSRDCGGRIKRMRVRVCRSSHA
jgi:hypothetical protein